MSKLNKLGTTQAAVPPPITSKVMMNHKKETKSKSAVKSSAEAEDTPVFNRSHVCTQLHVGEHMAMKLHQLRRMWKIGRLGQGGHLVCSCSWVKTEAV